MILCGKISFYFVFYECALIGVLDGRPLYSRSIYFANFVGNYQISVHGQDGIELSKHAVGEDIK